MNAEPTHQPHCQFIAARAEEAGQDAPCTCQAATAANLAPGPLPCPFCGVALEAEGPDVSFHPGQGPSGCILTHLRVSKYDAQFWNRRVAASVPAQQMDPGFWRRLNEAEVDARVKAQDATRDAYQAMGIRAPLVPTDWAIGVMAERFQAVANERDQWMALAIEARDALKRVADGQDRVNAALRATAQVRTVGEVRTRRINICEDGQAKEIVALVLSDAPTGREVGAIASILERARLILVGSDSKAARDLVGEIDKATGKA